jgi:hypothetical protein
VSAIGKEDFDATHALRLCGSYQRRETVTGWAIDVGTMLAKYSNARIAILRRCGFILFGIRRGGRHAHPPVKTLEEKR